MKTNKIFLSAALITTGLLFTTSCKKTFYTNANINTNQPTVVPPSTLLPGIEVSLAYAQGGDASRYSQLLIQQGYGAAREANAYYLYEFGGTNLPEQLWDNMYTSDMENDYTLLQMANSNNYNEYAGIANILMAYSLQTTCDFWGSIPYSQAFQGSQNISPKYDADATIYATINTLIATGIADLHKTPGALIPSADDVMYGGNVNSWIGFAWALQARVDMHQCKTNNVAMCQAALIATDSALAPNNNFTTAQVVFPGVPNSNPNYQYLAAWGDITYTNLGGNFPTLYDTMLIYSDPRIGAYFDTTLSAIGMNSTTNYYGQAGSPVEFITLEEMYFIQAEAIVRSQGVGGLPAAQTAYTAGITQNFTKLGISASLPPYLTTEMGSLGNNVTEALYQIGKQEWMSYFMNPEAWTSWRRTGAPALQSTVAGSAIPRRMVLPNSEITENSNAPQGETLWTPVLFWDN